MAVTFTASGAKIILEKTFMPVALMYGAEAIQAADVGVGLRGSIQ